MSRKLIWMISMFVLAGVLSGVGYANPIKTQITFGPSSMGAITTSTTTETFSGVSGWAYQGANSGNPGFTVASASLSVAGGGGGIFTLAPNAMDFMVVISPDSLDGTLSLGTVAFPAPNVAVFLGTLTVISATPGFQSTGFVPGSVAHVDFSVFNGNLSSGEIVPIPEPGTIALVGSGLLAIAGVLRRRS